MYVCTYICIYGCVDACMYVISRLNIKVTVDLQECIPGKYFCVRCLKTTMVNYIYKLYINYR